LYRLRIRGVVWDESAGKEGAADFRLRTTSVARAEHAWKANC
jgi:hypothetical protein